MPATETNGMEHEEIRKGLKAFLTLMLIITSVIVALVTIAVKQQRELVRTQTMEAQAKASAVLGAQQEVCKQPKYATTQACLDVATRVNYSEFAEAVQDEANVK